MTMFAVVETRTHLAFDVLLRPLLDRRGRSL